MSLLLRTPEEVQGGFPLLLDIVEEGVILFDGHGLARDAFAVWRQRLAHRGARRVRLGGTWHWDLGPGGWGEDP